MQLIRRWLTGAVLALLAAVAGAAALVWVLVAGSLPVYDGTVRVAGIAQPVEIVRDANAIPRIRAETDHDAFFALGLVHAQDRLWQMELTRRSAQGRLSELLGPRTVGFDRLVRTLDLYGHARRAVGLQSNDARMALEAYAAGVNAWIAHVEAAGLGRGAPEFYLMGRPPEPWVPADSIAVLKLMALRLSSGAAHEVRRARFQLALPPDRVRDILPDDLLPARLTVPRFAELFPGVRLGAAMPLEPDPLVAALGPAARPELAGASNAWAVDGSRSSSKRPLLANDPHLWLSAPGVWYLADIRGARIDAVGGTLPGAPLVLIGHNGEVGWGLTTANVDDQDLFIEDVHPDDETRYRTPEGWEPFDTRTIRIEVDGAPALEEVVRATRHGPVLAPEHFGVGDVTPAGHVAALAWTALSDDDLGLSGVIALMRARTRAEAMAAAAMVLAPAQMVTLADRQGIAIAMAGRVPDRDPASQTRGRVPAPGWVRENDWRGLRPADTNPAIIDPSEGALAIANNRLTEDPFPRHISFDWAPPYRIWRVQRALSGRRFHSRDSFVALQNDTVSEMARSVLPLIARELWWGDGPLPAEGQEAEALALLADWTGDMNRHRPEGLIFSEWMRWLTRRLAEDELGELMAAIEGPRPLFVERVFRNLAGAAVWCDVTKTPQVETCAEMAERALNDALASLTQTYGPDISAWRWGEAHVAVHRHAPLGHFPWIGPLVNIEQETSGGNHTLNRGQSEGRGPDPFYNVHAAGLRIVMDFADLDRTVAITSTGQSGHPFSRWYDHFSGPWARGEGIEISRRDADIHSGSVGVMRLEPLAHRGTD